MTPGPGLPQGANPYKVPAPLLSGVTSMKVSTTHRGFRQIGAKRVNMENRKIVVIGASASGLDFPRVHVRETAVVHFEKDRKTGAWVLLDRETGNFIAGWSNGLAGTQGNIA